MSLSSHSEPIKQRLSLSHCTTSVWIWIRLQKYELKGSQPFGIPQTEFNKLILFNQIKVPRPLAFLSTPCISIWALKRTIHFEIPMLCWIGINVYIWKVISSFISIQIRDNGVCNFFKLWFILNREGIGKWNSQFWRTVRSECSWSASLLGEKRKYNPRF